MMKRIHISRSMLLQLSMIPVVIVIFEAGRQISAQKLLSASWQHVSIDASLPGDSYGTGAFTLADYDMDGDMDITLNRREIDNGRVYWYKNTDGSWKRYDVGVADQEQQSAAVTDVNNDGYPDLVVARYWFENPKVLDKDPDSLWNKHTYTGGLPFENHDLAAFDFNGDGKDEILCYSQKAGGGTLRLYILNDPERWIYYDISVSLNQSVQSVEDTNGIHGGFLPGGIGDLNNDGYADIVMPSGWFKNPGKNLTTSWDFSPWPFEVGITPNKYGISFRSWIADIDHDNDNDIIYTDCDTEGSKGYWIINRRGGEKFEKQELPSPGEPTGSFHSLIVADFDKDNDLDIFTGEQEDPDEGMKPKGLNERGFFWENTGSRKRPVFQVSILNAGNPGWHDVKAGDIDGDGDIDMVSKVWNKDGRYYHADMWENLISNE